MATQSSLPIASAPAGEVSKSDSQPKGLTSSEASLRLKKDGPNAMPDVSVRPIINFLSKFWAPIPWLLEASLVLEVGMHKYFEAAIIAGLLLFNATLAFVQEGRAQATLKALQSRLALNASVLRMVSGRRFQRRTWCVAIWSSCHLGPWWQQMSIWSQGPSCSTSRCSLENRCPPRQVPARIPMQDPSFAAGRRLHK